jgi:diguanylate cyclase (GGDEF)-like protein
MQRYAFVLSLALVPVVGWVAHLLGHALNVALPFTPLYLIPLTISAWFCGRRLGLATAAATSLTLYLAARDFAEQAGALYLMVAFQSVTYVMVTLLVAYLRAVIEEERSLARTDPLTELLNARAFHEVAAVELRRAARYKRPLSCIVIDLDHFKDVNDTLGHAAGDDALKLIGNSMRKTIRVVDIASRIGGDEFCLLLPETGTDGAVALVDRIRQQIAITSFGKLSISVGCVTFIDIPGTVNQMLRESDLAMYAAKAKGGGTTEFRTFKEVAQISREDVAN